MTEEWKRLGPTSEMLALSGIGFTKNVLICLIDIRGALNVEVLLRSAIRAGKKYPQLNSVITETREHRLYYLEWEPREPDELPAFFQDLSKTGSHAAPIDETLSALGSRLDRDWDLFVEPPAEFHCIKLSEDRYLIGWVIHHAAGDAALGSDVGRLTLQIYHETTHGCTTDWDQEYLSFSGAQKRPVRRNKPRLPDIVKDFRKAAGNLFRKPTLPAGSGDKYDSRQHHSKRVFSEHESDELLKRLRTRGMSLVDALVATCSYSIDSWNTEQNVRPGYLSASVSVNMRGRFSEIDKGNSSSLIFFDSTPEERNDSRNYTRSIAIRRIHHFRKQVDLTMTNNIGMMVNAARIFPYHLRKKIVAFITNQHEFSIAVTLLGVIWPKIEKGRFTSDSALSEIGDLRVEEVIGIPYKMLSKTRNLIMVYIFRKRLNFVLSSSASLFSKDENGRFLDLILEKMRQL